jgi:hypothetical protein
VIIRRSENMISNEAIAEIKRVSEGIEKPINDRFEELLNHIKTYYSNGCDGMSCELCTFKNYDEDYVVGLLCNLMRELSLEYK